MSFKRSVGANDAHSDIVESERHARVSGLGEGAKVEIEPAAARSHPARAAREVGRVVGVFPCAYAHLAEVVGARPHKVADEGGAGLGEQPKLSRVRTKCLGA